MGRRSVAPGFTALARRACPRSSQDRSADGVRCHSTSFEDTERTREGGCDVASWSTRMGVMLCLAGQGGIPETSQLSPHKLS
jgi:hypothetical protein